MQLLEKHFGDAKNAEGREKLELAKQHSDAVVACLNAINSLTEWAPVPDFAEYKIIDQLVNNKLFVALDSYTFFYTSLYNFFVYFSLLLQQVCIFTFF